MHTALPSSPPSGAVMAQENTCCQAHSPRPAQQGWSLRLCQVLILLSHTRSMAFPDVDVRALVSAAAQGAFGGSGGDKVVQWVQYVASVQDAPADTHPLIFYAGTARALAESIGSVEPADYAEEKMRDFITSSLQVNAVPFDQDQEEQWKNFKLKPAHITLALKVQTKAMREFPPGRPGSSSAADQTAQAIAEWAKVQNAKAEKEAKRGTLSFNLQDRIAEVGLRCVQGDLLPT